MSSQSDLLGISIMTAQSKRTGLLRAEITSQNNVICCVTVLRLKFTPEGQIHPAPWRIHAPRPNDQPLPVCKICTPFEILCILLGGQQTVNFRLKLMIQWEFCLGGGNRVCV